MSGITYTPPPGWNGQWILLPDKLNPNRPKITPTAVQMVASPKLDMIGNYWKELPTWLKMGIPTATLLVCVASLYLVKIPIILLSTGILLACWFGKSQADRLQLNNMKIVCQENEEYFYQFKREYEEFAEKVNKVTDDKVLREICLQLNLLGEKHLEGRRDQLLEAYHNAYGQFSDHWITTSFLGLISKNRYFCAWVNTCIQNDGEKIHQKVFDQRIQSLQKTLADLNVRISQLHDNIQSLRYS